MNTIRSTFRGRFDDGKGADLLIDIIPKFLLQPTQYSWEFHLFGSGKYGARLNQLNIDFPQVKCHGRSSRDQIKKIAQDGHYCLCPSTIIESFGMSALEGSKLGLPIIGPSKGGLQQFLITDFEELRISGTGDAQGLLSQLDLIDAHHDTLYTSRKQQTLEIAARYGPSIRTDTISTLL